MLGAPLLSDAQTFPSPPPYIAMEHHVEVRHCYLRSGAPLHGAHLLCMGGDGRHCYV
jgi:hypothetical protein